MTLFDQAAPRPPKAPRVRVAMRIAYDGSGFHGFAPNVGVRTVGGILTEALAKVLRHDIELTCAGRTDRGVHARGQVITFDATAEGLDLGLLETSVNRLTGDGVAIVETTVVAPSFDARSSADGRTYRYRILNSPVPDPFLTATTWRIGHPLTIRSMELAGDPLLGEHDFSSFCRRQTARDGTERSRVRRLENIRWTRDGDLVVCEVTASSFCQQMVRSLVGTFVEIGLGKRRASDMNVILASRDRSAAGQLAPPQGLFLWAVRYPDDPFGPNRQVIRA